MIALLSVRDRCVLNLATGEITPLMVPLPDAKSQVHIFKTRIHSSRMRTFRCNGRFGGGAVCLGGCLTKGGGLLPGGGVPGPGGCLVPGGGLLRGMPGLRGVGVWYPSMH